MGVTGEGPQGLGRAFLVQARSGSQGAWMWVWSGLVWAWSEGCMSQHGFSQCTNREGHADGKCWR